MIRVYGYLFLLVLAALSCKQRNLDTDKPSYFQTSDENVSLKSRRALCEGAPHKIWMHAEEVCLDEEQDKIDGCNAARTTRWDIEKRECISDENKVALLRKKNECEKKGGRFLSGACELKNP
jgi:hypothetical protein